MSYTIALLTKKQQRKAFDCGQSDLNDFIKLYALQQQKRGQNKNYVACQQDGQIIGFYSLNVGAVSFEEIPSEIQKRLARYPVPAVCLGRSDLPGYRHGQATAAVYAGAGRAGCYHKADGFFGIILA